MADYEFLGIKKRIPLLLQMPHSYAGYAAESLKRAGVDPSDIRVTSFGVRVMTDEISAVMGCRLYDRLYLTVPIKRGEKLTGKSAPEVVASSMLKRVLDTYIMGPRPVACRVSVELSDGSGKKSSREKSLDKKRRLTEIFSRAISDSLGDDITIDEGKYECEIYFPGRADGSFGFFLRAACMGDNRFSYRRAVESSSMSAVRAATMVEMLSPFLIEDDSVLDPFCGTGTLLIERMCFCRTGHVFGTDISPVMVAGARENAALASKHIHFIQRDFFDFTYEGVFDEVITELPDLYHRSEREKKGFFTSFLDRCIAVTAEGSIYGILTGDADIFSQIIKKYKLLSTERTISFGGKREVFILRRV